MNSVKSAARSIFRAYSGLTGNCSGVRSSLYPALAFSTLSSDFKALFE
jgi:hypothetical protein